MDERKNPVIFNSDCDFIPVNAFKHHWTRKNFSYLEKPRPDFGIMFILNGRIDFISKNETLCAKANDMIFLPINGYYEVIFRYEYGEIDSYMVNFETNSIPPEYNKPLKIAEDASLRCIDFFERLTKESFTFNHTEFHTKGLFYLLLDSILRNSGSISSTHKTVLDRACELLHESNDLSIRDIARKCCVSESGLRKLFNDNLNISPAKYRLNIKLNKAKALLESTDMSVKEIANELNFYDVAYFCKIFRDNIKMTPRQYSQSKKL